MTIPTHHPTISHRATSIHQQSMHWIAEALKATINSCQAKGVLQICTKMFENEQDRGRNRPPRDDPAEGDGAASSDWWQKLQTLAFSLVAGPNSHDYQQVDSERRLKRRNRAAVSIITLVFAIYLRRRRMRRTNPTRQHSLSSVIVTTCIVEESSHIFKEWLSKCC